MGDYDSAHLPPEVQRDLDGEKVTHVAFVLDRSGSMGAIRDEIIDAFNEQLEQVKERAEDTGEVRVSFVSFGGGYNYTTSYTTPQPPPSPPVWPTVPNWTDSTSNWQYNPTITSGATGSDSFEVVWGGVPTGLGSPVQEHFFEASVDRLERLDRENYVPSGFTPMLDGVGHAIDRLAVEDGGGEDEAFLVIVLSDGKENASKHYKARDIRERVTKLQNSDRWTFVYIGSNQDLTEVQDRYGFMASNTVAFTSTSSGTTSMSVGMKNATRNYMDARTDGLTSYDDYGADMKSEMDEDETDSGGI